MGVRLLAGASPLYLLGKTLEIVGMSVALMALAFGIEEGSMGKEFGYLFLAGLIFWVGWLVEKRAGR